MLVRAPSMETKQNGPVRIQDLAKVVMNWRHLRPAEKQLIPSETAGNISHADNCPRAFHAFPLSLNLARQASRAVRLTWTSWLWASCPESPRFMNLDAITEGVAYKKAPPRRRASVVDIHALGFQLGT
jgi:hypothetical protein